MGRMLLLAWLGLSGLVPAGAPGPEASQECVVLLHGLARSERSMIPAQLVFEAAGYKVINQGYPSREKSIEELAREAVSNTLVHCADARRVHFLTHSMGGILLRQWLVENRIENLGRSVMLGPPNGGSEIVDTFGHLRLFEMMNGPAGTQLGTGEMDLPRKLGAANFDLGIVAGTRSLNPITSSLVPGRDDGKVSVESAFAVEASDRITIPVSHTFMMMDKEVLRQSLHFIAHGRFQRQ